MVTDGGCGSDGKDWGDDGTAMNGGHEVICWGSVGLIIGEGSMQMGMGMVLDWAYKCMM